MIEILGWGEKISILKVSGILNPNIKWDQRNGEAYSPTIRRGINSFNLSNLLFLSPSDWETFKCVFHSMGIGTDLLLRYSFLNELCEGQKKKQKQKHYQQINVCFSQSALLGFTEQIHDCPRQSSSISPLDLLPCALPCLLWGFFPARKMWS